MADVHLQTSNDVVMNKSIFIVMAFIAISGIYGSAFAQYTVKGHIFNEITGRTLPGAQVYINELNRGTVTDRNGDFAIKNIPKGKFTIEFSFIGFETVTRNIDLNHTGSTDINVSMKRITYEPQPIVVLGNRFERIKNTPLPVNVLRQRDVVMGGNSSLWQSLNQINGVTLTTNGPGIERPVIRGLTSDRIMIMEQGIPYGYQSWDHESGLSMTGNGAEQVQVIKGPATLLYGPGALGGAINLIGERPAPAGHTIGDVTLKGFSNTSGISANLKLKGTNRGIFWGLRGGFGSNTDYKDGLNTDIRNSRYNNVEGEAFGGITRKWGVLKLTYHFRQHKNGIVETADSGGTGEENIRQIEPPYHNLIDHSVIAETKIIAGSGWITGKLAYQRNHQQEFEPPMYSTGKPDAGMDLTLNTITYHTGYDRELGRFFHINTGFQGNVQGNVSQGGEPFVPGARMNQVGAYALLNWDKNKIRWQAGIRYDFNHVSTTPALGKDSTVTRFFGVNDEITRNFHNFSWSIGGTWQWTPDLSIKSNIGIGYRIPNLAELTADGILREQDRYLIGDNALRAERNIEWDTSALWESPNLNFSVDMYYNRIHHYIYAERQPQVFFDTKPPDLLIPYPIYRYRQKTANLYGGEADISLHPVNLPWFHLRTGYSMTVGYFGHSIKDALPRMPAHEWRNSLKLTVDHIGRLTGNYLKLTVVRTFRQGRVAFFEFPTPGYTLTSIGVGTTFHMGKTRLQMSLFAHNLFNVSYYSHLSYLKFEHIFNMGRNISLTVRIPFILKDS